jgi:hypothetical protein
VIGGLRRACGGAAADRFKTPLQCTQTLVDFTDLGGERAGVSGSLKHGCSRGARVAAPLVDALEPGVDLAFGFVLGHAIALLESAAELCALALDHVEIVIGELTPLLLNFAFELFPIAFDTIPIHRFAPVVVRDGERTRTSEQRFRRTTPRMCPKAPHIAFAKKAGA